MSQLIRGTPKEFAQKSRVGELTPRERGGGGRNLVSRRVTMTHRTTDQFFIITARLRTLRGRSRSRLRE